MRNLHYLVQELPHICIRPLNDWIDDDAILAVDATDFLCFLPRELVLVDVLELLGNPLLTPSVKLVQVPRELVAGNLYFLALGAVYRFRVPDTRESDLARTGGFLELRATPAELHRRNHTHFFRRLVH